MKQMHNDKRSLAIILIAPILIMSLLFLLLGESSYVPSIGVDASFNGKVLEALKEQKVEIIDMKEAADIDAFLKEKGADAVVSMNKDGIVIRMLEENSTKALKITDALKNAMKKINPAGGISMTFIYGKSDATMFNSLGYILVGFISFFFVFIISGMSFVRERTTGTMERLMLTPISRIGLVSGYTIGYGIFAALQGILIILFTKSVLHMEYAGSVLLAMLIMILLSFTAVLIGALVSIFANSEFQVMQFIPIVIIPQFFFSGLIPIDTLPFGLGKLAYIMPIYYGCSGLQEVLVKGRGIEHIWGYLGMLAAFIIVLLIINTEALRKYRRL
jgi:ABC-2 type transport system permease protein